MSKILKTITLLTAVIVSLPILADYRVTIPLELTQGGSLPNGSINIGNNLSNPENENNSCYYSKTNETMVTFFTESFGPFKVGDRGYVYSGRIIGYYSPSNGYDGPPAGLSVGEFQESGYGLSNYEICLDSNINYPTLPDLAISDEEGPKPPTDPEPEDQTGPDWTPECIFNINSDYSAYDTINRKYIMNSAQFGISVESRTWYHVPEDYDPDREGSYVYLDNSDETGSMAGPNPNYTYAGICRVRKILL